MARRAKPEIPCDRVYTLYSMQAMGQDVFCIVVLPEETIIHNVRASWSYCIRWTAKGLDVPDYQAALAMMKERYPSWIYIETNNQVSQVAYSGGFRDEDVIPPEIDT
jgi:hypothetical protein